MLSTIPHTICCRRLLEENTAMNWWELTRCSLWDCRSKTQKAADNLESHIGFNAVSWVVLTLYSPTHSCRSYQVKMTSILGDQICNLRPRPLINLRFSREYFEIGRFKRAGGIRPVAAQWWHNSIIERWVWLPSSSPFALRQLYIHRQCTVDYDGDW